MCPAMSNANSVNHNDSGVSETQQAELTPQPLGEIDTFRDQEEIVFYKSIWSQGPQGLLFLLFMALAVYLTVEYPESIQYHRFKISEGFSINVRIPLFALAPILVLVFIVHSLCDARYIINRDYVRAIHGLWSFRKRDVRLEYQDLRGVEIERSLYGRIVNVGDLKIWSLMPTEVELMLSGVRDPSYYRDIIMSRKKHHPLKL